MPSAITLSNPLTVSGQIAALGKNSVRSRCTVAALTPAKSPSARLLLACLALQDYAMETMGCESR
jgi:hypothetical protein